MNFTLFLFLTLIIPVFSEDISSEKPKYFFRELFNTWLSYMYDTSSSINESNVKVENLLKSENVERSSDRITDKSTLDNGADISNVEETKQYQCELSVDINYWNYKSGSVTALTDNQIIYTYAASNEENKTQNSTANGTKQKCSLILIYSQWCKYSMLIAPVFNALGRLYPQLDLLALQTGNSQSQLIPEMKWNMHTSYVPRIKLYYGSKPMLEALVVCSGVGQAQQLQLESLVDWIYSTTSQLPHQPVRLNPHDYQGPISSEITQEINYYWLISAWILTIFCSGYLFIVSTNRPLAAPPINR